MIRISYSAIANLPTHKSLGHAKSSQSSLVVSWQRIYNSLTVTTAHTTSSLHMLTLNWQLNCDSLPAELSIQSQGYVTTDGQSVSLSWNEAPIWGLQIFITVSQLQVCWYGALSLTRERVCRLPVTALISLLSICTIYILHVKCMYIQHMQGLCQSRLTGPVQQIMPYL
jgi:hypothetical protein